MHPHGQPMRMHFGPIADLGNLLLDPVDAYSAFNLYPHPLCTETARLSRPTTTYTAQLKMDRLTGVLIGCGGIARRHLAALAELPHVEVAAVCDLSAARAEATAERFGIAKWYSNYQRLLAEVNPNLVHITTPPSSHFSIAKVCLASGLNVICEKPITTSYQEFQELKELAIGNNCLLMENQNFQFHSSIRRICDLIISGKLGDLIDVQVCLSANVVAPGSPFIDPNAPHYSLALPGGAIGDFLTHIAYLTYMFTGSVIDMRTTWSKRSKDSPLPADEFRAFIKGARATAYVAFNGNARPYGFWIRVTGTKMHAEANLFEPPRLAIRRLRDGEPAVMSLIDGVASHATCSSVRWQRSGGSSRVPATMTAYQS